MSTDDDGFLSMFKKINLFNRLNYLEDRSRSQANHIIYLTNQLKEQKKMISDYERQMASLRGSLVTMSSGMKILNESIDQCSKSAPKEWNGEQWKATFKFKLVIKTIAQTKNFRMRMAMMSLHRNNFCEPLIFL